MGELNAEAGILRMQKRLERMTSNLAASGITESKREVDGISDNLILQKGCSDG